MTLEEYSSLLHVTPDSGLLPDDEFFGQCQINTTPSPSLAAEIHSATMSPTMTDIHVDTDFILSPDPLSPTSPLVFHYYNTNSRRNSFAFEDFHGGGSSSSDPFLDHLRQQLEELNTTVWETKTLHKRMFNTLLAKNDVDSRDQRVELKLTATIDLIKTKSRDRERQISFLLGTTSNNHHHSYYYSLSQEDTSALMDLLHSLMATLRDPSYAYKNPLPMLRTLKIETLSMAESLEELKELMFVNKRQVQELNARLRSITRAVHEVRKDYRRLHKFFGYDDNNEPTKEEEEEQQEQQRCGRVEQAVKEITSGLDDLAEETSIRIKEMQLFWEELR